MSTVRNANALLHPPKLCISHFVQLLTFGVRSVGRLVSSVDAKAFNEFILRSLNFVCRRCWRVARSRRERQKKNILTSNGLYAFASSPAMLFHTFDDIKNEIHDISFVYSLQLCACFRTCFFVNKLGASFAK